MKHKTWAYSPETDELYVDGVVVGSAADLTREMMLGQLTDADAHAKDTDETLFDLVVG